MLHTLFRRARRIKIYSFRYSDTIGAISKNKKNMIFKQNIFRFSDTKINYSKIKTHDFYTTVTPLILSTFQMIYKTQDRVAITFFSFSDIIKLNE